MLLSILRAYEDDRLSLKQIRQLLRTMENFHFQFSAVTAQRTGGGTALMFALGAREMEAAPTKNKADQVIKNFADKLRGRLPSFIAFEAGFADIKYMEDSSKQRPIIRYILGRIDEHFKKDPTIDYDQMTIEHIAPQNPGGGPPIPNAGAIGNLILIPPNLNSKVLGNKTFDKKRAELQKAAVHLDQSILSATAWGDTEIEARTKELAKLAYEKVFRA
jgi:hypothetical protein